MTQQPLEKQRVLRVIIDERSVTFGFVWAFMWRFFILYLTCVLAVAIPVGVMTTALDRQYGTQPNTTQQ